MDTEEPSARNEAEAPRKLERGERQSVQGTIAIKGTRNGLLLTLEPETPFGDVLHALSARLAEAPGFFRGASMAVDTSRRALQGSERTQLEALLAHYEVSVLPLEQVIAARREAQARLSAQQALPSPESSFQITGEQPRTTRSLEVSEGFNLYEDADTLFIRRTVRSGQAIHHSSNIVIFGDVNPGAEVVAGGDILVWGVLRGLVHAGYPDNQNAVICSLVLAPVQLRIAHLLSRPPEGYEVRPRPEVAAIRNGQIVVEAWVNGRPPRR